MLEKLPSSVGHVLRGARSGMNELIFNESEMAQVPATIQVSSPAFGEGQPIPTRYTEDGEKRSPPLDWRGVPPGARAVVLLIEDADSPTPAPLVHGIVWDLPGRDGGLRDGELPNQSGQESGKTPEMGRNSFLQTTYLPPDPPPGHGVHRYAFQVYALDRSLDFAGSPGRGALLDAMKDHVLAKGCLVGTYQRN